MAVLFEGLDLWVVDALRRKPHPTHPHLADDARMDSARWRRSALS